MDYYLIVEEMKWGDIFTHEAESEEDAIWRVENDYKCLSDYDKRQIQAMYALRTDDPESLDGDIIARIV